MKKATRLIHPYDVHLFKNKKIKKCLIAHPSGYVLVSQVTIYLGSSMTHACFVLRPHTVGIMYVIFKVGMGSGGGTASAYMLHYARDETLAADHPPLELVAEDRGNQARTAAVFVIPFHPLPSLSYQQLVQIMPVVHQRGI